MGAEGKLALYAANRAPWLKPVTVGSHGESMRGLLRAPGSTRGRCRSCTASRGKPSAPATARGSRLHHELEHAGEGVHRFAERELLPLLAGSRDWGGVAVEVRAVRFGVQRAEVEFAAPALGRDPFVLAFENVNGLIEARIAATGWADKLTGAQREVFAFALCGLLDMAAAARYDIFARGPDAPTEPGFGALTHRVTWEEWVARWEATKAALSEAGSVSDRSIRT